MKRMWCRTSRAPSITMTLHFAWQSGDLSSREYTQKQQPQKCHNYIPLNVILNRNNLSGADQLFVTKFNELFGRAAYSEAAKVSNPHQCCLFTYHLFEIGLFNQFTPGGSKCAKGDPEDHPHNFQVSTG